MQPVAINSVQLATEENGEVEAARLSFYADKQTFEVHLAELFTWFDDNIPNREGPNPVSVH